ncbi:MAG: exo-beta-1,3-glucanase [Armatimonadetes bacterium]|nr:exo-beta-1,3-glucanase [Armatimonadota bacterium]
MRNRFALLLIGLSLFVSTEVWAQGKTDSRFPLFAYLTGTPTARVVTYAPSRLDPRSEANQHTLKTSDIRADLIVLRPTFDGLILYGYNEACTPRILAIAKALKYRAVILGVWDIKSRNELMGAVTLANEYKDSMAIGLLIGNEGINFGRYEQEDLTVALESVRAKLAPSIPIGTSEPLGRYDKKFVRSFGDFLAPNIHPVFDRPNMNPSEAAAWAREEALKLMKTSGKPVLLKETGFPHDGKPAYTPESQSAFWSAYLKPGAIVRGGGNWVFHGVAFEAFDLPWKSEASGLPIEKSWGLFSQARKPYPVLSAWIGLK